MKDEDPTIAWYNHHVDEVAERYEALSFPEIHGWLIPYLPEEGEGVVLDVGAGTGRDVAWLAARGHRVVAVEPSSAMRAEGRSRHMDSGIDWVDDRLPKLSRVLARSLIFDLILLSAVWMHIPSSHRPQAFRVLCDLLRPGGVVAITLRQGPIVRERGIGLALVNEVVTLARANGIVMKHVERTYDQLDREEVSWVQVAASKTGPWLCKMDARSSRERVDSPLQNALCESTRNCELWGKKR